ncbi:MAG: hypothetical protein HY924_08500 [Elusimicrobia bacterium]|nr:hypothetical protein [Elusimicrobiota bacterium]
MKTPDLAPLKKSFRRECAEDHVGLWSIVRSLRITFGENLARQLVRDATMEIVTNLLQSRTIKPGFPASNGRDFEPWNLSPDEAIARIQSEWDELGREPTIGEIVWFTSVP